MPIHHKKTFDDDRLFTAHTVLRRYLRARTRLDRIDIGEALTTLGSDMQPGRIEKPTGARPRAAAGPAEPIAADDGEAA